MEINYIKSTRKHFEYYKSLGDKAMSQIGEKELFFQPNENSNSIAIIIQHLWGNMRSRWVDFLTTDGEKEWRDRDGEFELNVSNGEELMLKWEEGWKYLFDALDQVTDKDLERIVYIRNQGHTVLEAINRQLAHYPYHVGQIVYLARMLALNWESLSIPKNHSQAYNEKKFELEKQIGHFTDEFLNKK